MKNNKKERGVALLYVLGILALLMMMALAFVSSSLFDQRAAANIARRSQANILALSMLERVTAAIQEYSGDLKYSYSDETAKDMFEMLDTYNVIGGNKKSYLFNYHKPSVEDKEIKDNIRWIAHKIESEDGPLIIGRSAFIIKSYGRGLFNANDLSKASLNEQDQLERRIGVKMNEVNVKYFDNTFFSSSVVTSAVEWADLFNQNGIGNGILPAANITDFVTRAEAQSGGVTIPQANIDTIEKYFTFSNAESDEAYWMDLNSDGKRDTNEFFHRFYLPGTDTGRNIWEEHIGDTDRVNKVVLMERSGTSGIPDIDLADASVIGGMWRLTHPTPALDPDEKDKYGCGIPWLATFGLDSSGAPDETLKGTFGLVKHRRQQIAANLIDYCDSDNIPTSDVLPTNWKLTGVDIPLYTGNERTPYLNEIQALIGMDAELTSTTDSDTGVTTVDIKGMLDFKIDAEAINIYKALDTSKEMRVELECSFSNIVIEAIVDGINQNIPPTGITVPSPISITLDIPPPIPEYFTGADDIFKVFLPTVSLGPYNSVPTTGDFKVKFDLTIKNAILKYDGLNVDYCKIDKTFSFEESVEAKGGGGNTKTFIYSFQTEDPRQNLNSGDWIALEKIETTNVADDTNIGKINLHGNPKEPHNPSNMYSGFDIEQAINPAYLGDADDEHISTAHIRNAPMISPWELTFIHRGAKWQTLNLKAYNDEKARSLIKINLKDYLPGGGKYSEGDANILDQIKMTIDPISNDKKLNLADATDDVLKGFLGGLYLGCEPNLIDTALVDDFTEQLARGSGSESSVVEAWIEGINNIRDSSTRAGLANAGALHRGKTEASQTEIIGKIINLVEINKGSPMEYFEAIIVSQSIKDVGDRSPSGLPLRKVFKDTGSQLTIKKDFNAKKGQIDSPVDNDKNYIADEVTGQCKLLVSGYRNPGTHKVQLISIKTVE